MTSIESAKASLKSTIPCKPLIFRSSRIREEFKKAELIRELENANKVEVYDKQFQINSELTSPASHTGRLPGKNTPKKEKNMLVRNPSAGSNSSNVFMKKNFQILNEFGDIKSSGKFPKTTKNAQKKETLDDYIEKMINDKGIDPKYLAKAKSKLSSIEADINQKYQSVKNQYNKELNLKEIFN